MLIMEMAIDIDHSQLIKRLSPIGYPVIEADCTKQKTCDLKLRADRLRHIAGTAWSTKRYLNIGVLKDQQMRGAITA